MKTREEQVEKMAKAIYATGVALDGADYAFGVYDNDDHFHRMANALYDAGYRKQGDTVREFVEKIAQFASAVRLLESKVYDKESRLVKAMYAMGKIEAIKDMMREIKKLAKEYGVEVEE